jgi:hypothetical protein
MGLCQEWVQVHSLGNCQFEQSRLSCAHDPSRAPTDRLRYLILGSQRGVIGS